MLGGLTTLFFLLQIVDLRVKIYENCSAPRQIFGIIKRVPFNGSHTVYIRTGWAKLNEATVHFCLQMNAFTKIYDFWRI